MIAKALTGSRIAKERGSASFDIYLEEVGEIIDKGKDAAAAGEWLAVSSAAPAERGKAPGYPAVLRDYASHRYRAQVVELTRELVRCRTYEAPEIPVASNDQFLRARTVVDSLGRAYGFDVATLANGLAMELAFGSGRDTLGFWTHLDVVPADTAGWTHDPWAAEVVDGAVHGRGSQDDKGAFAAAFYALVALRDTGVPIGSRIVLFAGFAEETTFDCINGYLAERPAPSRNVVLDAAFPVVVGEKGTVWLRVSSNFKRIAMRNCPEGFKIEEFTGGLAANQVPAFARIRLWPVDKPMNRAMSIIQRRVTDFNVENSRAQLSARRDGNSVVVEAIGRTAHGSTPELGHNAIIDITEFVYELGMTCLQPTHHLIWFLNEFVREDVSARGLGVALRDSVMGRTTVNVGMVGTAFDSAWVVLDIRFPRGLSADAIVAKIRERIAPFNERYSAGLYVEKMSSLEPVYTDVESPLVKALLSAWSDVMGEPGQPIAIAGTTYAKKLPRAVSFGPAFQEEKDRAHGPDEFVTLDELDRMTRIYATAAFKLTR